MKRYLFIAVMLLATITCREKYEASFPMPETGYLVVEGIINTSGKTTVSLSRTSLLSERRIVPEQNAVVLIEGEDNSRYPVNQADSGKYVSEELQLNNSTKYRLHIATQNGKEYVSEFKAALQTPAIDSITWKRQNGGVEIFVNAYDPHSATKYYKWDYEETWEFRAHYFTFLELNVTYTGTSQPLANVGYIDSTRFSWDSSRYFCWQSRISRGIHIGTTEKLTENKVYVPLAFYPEDAPELNWMYSILVRQSGLSKEGYEFYEKMKKNTETLGSVFDPQPSEIKGNVWSVSDEHEPVIGYIDVTTSTEKRIFISGDELPGWFYDRYCPDSVVANTEETLRFLTGNYRVPTIVDKTDNDGSILSFYIADEQCADCRKSGTNIKPPFWPW